MVERVKKEVKIVYDVSTECVLKIIYDVKESLQNF